SGDSCYIGIAILVNNLRFVYDNGDTILVDVFQHDWPTPVEQIDALPAKYALYQNFPNPFNPSTKIRYEISQVSRVVLEVYSLTGETVATLVNEEQQAGTYEADFDGSNLPSG